MRADAFIEAAERLPFGTLDDVTRGGLVVVAPHPDDESLGCGGLIAIACARNVPVRLVVVSDGVGSHPGSRRWPPEALRALREAETFAAACALGLAPEHVSFLRLPDTAVPTTGPGAEAAAAAIVAAAKACDAGVVCVTWHRDPHCDHAASAAIVGACDHRLGTAAVLAYPVWGWTLPADAEVGPAPRGLRLDISSVLDRKVEAIAAHLSQTTDLIDDDPSGFRLSAEMLARFARPFETFLHIEAEAQP